MQGHSFWLAVRLNMGLGVRFLYSTNYCSLELLVQCFYWLANQSHVFRGLGPHKRRSRKRNRQIESWFCRPMTWSSCHPLRHHCRFTQVPQLDHPYENQFAQNGLGANCYRQLTYLRTKTLCFCCTCLFFNRCMRNNCCYLQLLTIIPDLLK